MPRTTLLARRAIAAAASPEGYDAATLEAAFAFGEVDTCEAAIEIKLAEEALGELLDTVPMVKEHGLYQHGLYYRHAWPLPCMASTMHGLYHAWQACQHSLYRR